MAILNLALSLLVLLRLAIAVVGAPPPESECVTELVSFSPCLAFVSAPPNNLSVAASPECCTAFSETTSGGGGGSLCFCHLVREPRLLGFPLESTRLLSLPSVCHLQHLSSLLSLCSGSDESMPPSASQNETDSRTSIPPDSAPSNQQSALISLPPGPSPSTDDPPTSSTEPERVKPGKPKKQKGKRLPDAISPSASAMADRIRSKECWFQIGTLVLVLYLSAKFYLLF